MLQHNIAFARSFCVKSKLSHVGPNAMFSFAWNISSQDVPIVDGPVRLFRFNASKLLDSIQWFRTPSVGLVAWASLKPKFAAAPEFRHPQSRTHEVFSISEVIARRVGLGRESPVSQRILQPSGGPSTWRTGNHYY